ncbi:hypothetical protein [Eremococcus coleocola]|uniref:hypothetical protein n=1 Tax=Eremococcus coleocola TaxID=88132 RepID=UPI0003FF5A19|nr:hypothetical protein [Eremococcus coleocola]
MGTVKYEFIAKNVEEAIEYVKAIKEAHHGSDDVLIINASTLNINLLISLSEKINSQN